MLYTSPYRPHFPAVNGFRDQADIETYIIYIFKTIIYICTYESNYMYQTQFKYDK